VGCCDVDSALIYGAHGRQPYKLNSVSFLVSHLICIFSSDADSGEGGGVLPCVGYDLIWAQRV